MKATGLKQQEAYIKRLATENAAFGLTMGEAFVRGMRDIGYKHTGTALDEQIDNSYQAGSEEVHVLFGYDNTTSNAKPSEIAVLDIAHGMVPNMIRASVMWGGTHRENDRTGFGRYGYGLPSSAISQGKRYTVYSKVEGKPVHAVTIDLDEIEAGSYSQSGGLVQVPLPRQAKLPKFVTDYINERFDGKWTSGTVVVMEKLDKLTRKTNKALHSFLMEHFGVTYHKLRDDFEIFLNGDRVEPIDPLFTTPGHRFYDLDEQRAQPQDDFVIPVKEGKEVIGEMRVRMSYMPPDFGSIDKMRGADKGNANDRFKILKDYNGFIFTRAGRVIDVVTANPLTTFQNNDRFIKIEIDFPAVLDEELNISTSKQKVDVSERMWDRLREAKLPQALKELRKVAKQDRAEMKERRERTPDKPRPSESAMTTTKNVTGKKPSREGQDKSKTRGEEGLENEAKNRSKKTGNDPKKERKKLEEELAGKDYKVEFEDLPGAPFFRFTQVGGTRVLFINRHTRFFKDVHSGPKSTAALRAALELLLFAIGDRTQEVNDTQQDWYVHEIGAWSGKLDFALGQLSQDIASED